jgi:DNA-binding beta-propeller fold protein YncE
MMSQIRVAALMLALTACSSQATLQPIGQPPARFAVPSAAFARPRPDRGASWLSTKAATSGSLLYVSDFYNFDVYIYRVAPFKLVGKLTGFFEPEGECSDARGNVWVAVTGDETIEEFKPGVKTPIATLHDPLGYPASCAVDAATGNLAVTNIFGTTGSGGILVYKNARGTPAFYANPDQFYYYFDGYDAHGNLYASGLTSKSVYVLSALRLGKKTMATLSIRGATLHFPGTVLWNGSTLVLGDQQCDGGTSSCLYDASVSGTTVSLTKKIPLAGSCDVAQVALQGKQLLGGDYEYCTHVKSSRVSRWAYPAGGQPIQSITGNYDPIGAAVTSD